jgi:hypothetical protein
LASHRLLSTFAKKMKYKAPVTLLGFLAIGYVSFLIGVKTTDDRLKKSMTKAAHSLGHKVTEEEMLKLSVRMTYLVNELDIQGLLNEQDTKEAALMMTVYRLLKEEKAEEALELSKAMMKGYLLREDEDVNLELQKKIRQLLESNSTTKFERTSRSSQFLSRSALQS